MPLRYNKEIGGNLGVTNNHGRKPMFNTNAPVRYGVDVAKKYSYTLKDTLTPSDERKGIKKVPKEYRANKAYNAYRREIQKQAFVEVAYSGQASFETMDEAQAIADQINALPIIPECTHPSNQITHHGPYP